MSTCPQKPLMITQYILRKLIASHCSFGVITLQILTKLFPKPGDRVQTFIDPRYPRAIKMDIPEINCRQNHI